MAYKFVPYAPEGSGGKDPVLTELVVTENGVYDEPVIAGGTPDFSVGKTVAFKEYYTLDNIPAEHRPAEGESFYQKTIVDDETAGGAFVVENGTFSIEFAASKREPPVMYLYFDETKASEFGVSSGWNFVADFTNMTFEKLDTPPSILVKNADWQEQLSEVSFLFAGVSTPADGWNKVTVNVAGDIIDVPELPTENVDDSKIYRISTEAEPIVWVAGTAMGMEANMPFADFYASLGVTVAVKTYVVASLPDTMEPMDQSTMTIPLYILESTGVAYVSMDGTSAGAMNLGAMLQIPDGGWADSADDIPMSATGIYIIRADKMTVYGLPNTADNKKFYEYDEMNGWSECDSGERLMVDVAVLPTENIEDKTYRIKTVAPESAEVWVVTNNGRVDKLEEILFDAIRESPDYDSGWADFFIVYSIIDDFSGTPRKFQNNSNTMTVYILRSTGLPYVSYDGSTYAELNPLNANQPYGAYTGTFNFGDYKGIIQYPEEAVEAGYYTVMTEAGDKITYGVPNPENNKTVYVRYDGEWVNVSAMKARCDVLEKMLTSLRG